MRKIESSSGRTDAVFLLVLFCVFSAAVLSVLLAGAGAYQNIAARMESQYGERTCLSYLDAKIRHYDGAGQVAVEPFQQRDALALYEEIEGVRYKTLIYYADGAVRELFFEDGLEFQPADGAVVIPAQDLQIVQKTDQLLQLTCISEQGRQNELLVYLRSGGERDSNA